MSASKSHCWRCREVVGGPVCNSCGSVQPPPPQIDPFELLGLERSYGLERKALDKRWRAISRVTHPDRFAGQAAVQRRMALQWTAHLNHARKVLRDPVSRAWYLATGSHKPPERGGPALDPSFLEAVFDLRMALDDDPEGVRAQAQALKDELEREITALFDAWQAGDGGLDEIPERLSRLKYVDNLLAPAQGI